jgi:uncharacterized protein
VIHRSVLLRLWTVGLVLAMLLAAGAALAQSSYPKRADTYINDYASLLTSDTAARIRGWLMDLKRDKDIEMTVLTISRMSDYSAGKNATLESFATSLFNTWGIGDARTNRGILLLVSRNDRKVRIEIGSGYDSSYNRKAQTVIDEYILPQFKKDAYDAGIEKGVRAAIFEFTGGWPTGGAPTFFESVGDSLGRIDGTMLLILGVGGLGALGLGAWWVTSHRCPQCGQVSLSISSDVITPATYDAPGQKEVHRSCSNCGFSDSYMATIGQLSDSDSSDSSSGGSSSDGGSSSGGGASGSW